MIGATDVWYLVSDGAVTTDDEGRTSSTPSEVAVEGRVDELGARDVEIAAQNGQTHDIVALADLTVDVNDRQRVRVVTPERLAGLYAIDTIRQTRRLQRVLCSRTTVNDG